MVNNGWVDPASSVPASPQPATPVPAPADPPATTVLPATAAVPAGGAATGAVPAGGAGGEPDEDDPPVRLERGQERSPKDMIMSLAVLLIPIALLLTFYRLVLDGDKPISVEAAPIIQEARQAQAFTVLEPRGLGDDWHASSATFRRETDGATLRLGYVDPDDDPIQLVQSSVPPATLLPVELTDKAEVVGDFRSAAGVWRLYDARPGEKALVLAEQGRTVIVLGKTDVDNLETLAGALS